MKKAKEKPPPHPKKESHAESTDIKERRARLQKLSDN